MVIGGHRCLWVTVVSLKTTAKWYSQQEERPSVQTNYKDSTLLNISRLNLVTRFVYFPCWHTAKLPSFDTQWQLAKPSLVQGMVFHP